MQRCFIVPYLLALLMGFLVLTGCKRPPSNILPVSSVEALPDAIVVGAGLSGLTTALEIARGGGRVVVVDMASVFGGHAVMAMGDLCIVETPAQQERGINDSPDLAYDDIMRWGQSPAPEWVRFYVENSRVLVHDWLVDLGVEFEAVLKGQGTENSVPRVHRTKGRGIGLLNPVMRECLAHPNITFEWNRRVERLQIEGGRVTGIAGTSMRTGMPFTLVGRSVVLATGGFQNNLDMVRQFWNGENEFPARFLVGSGIYSMGGGHEMATSAGAAVVEMNQQMNLASGIPDPRHPGGFRGLNARPYGSIWVNVDGRRFCAEFEEPEAALNVLLRQPGATFWAIFDEQIKPGFLVSGSDWGSFAEVERLILKNPELTKRADTIGELASLVGLPVVEVEKTVARYNQMVQHGDDADFGRWGKGRHPRSPAQMLAHPPFYAVQFFPLTRKSMGGVAVDLSCRVLAENGEVIPGLYAVGEMTGSALINGAQGISGMFLGPCILMGRVAGQTILLELGKNPISGAASVAGTPKWLTQCSASDTPTCLSCHELTKQIESPRQGWWHFEKVHRQALARGWDCASCHAEMSPAFSPERHRMDRKSLLQSCVRCHMGGEVN